MIINSVIIRQGLLEKSFSFSDGANLIYSKKNSVGKTTLLRVILYSLGYSIPGTKRFFLDRCEVDSSLLTDDGRQVDLSRTNLNYIIYKEGNKEQTFCLPEQVNELHALLFQTSNIDILNNLLGVFYLDQEKGWTLLNRGVVIGSNHFNVEEFIQGLSGKDCSELKRKRKWLETELNKYEQISNVVKYKESLREANGVILKENPDDELESQIELKQIELNVLKNELARIDRSLKSNERVRRFIDEMKLSVKMPDGSCLRVSADNVVGLNDSIDYLIAKRKIQAIECNKIINTITQLRDKKKQIGETIFSVESIADAFDEMVQKFPYGYMKVEEIKGKLKRHLTAVNRQISECTRQNNEVLNSIYLNVIKYAEQLDVIEDSGMSSSYLFTSNLKVLSGALLHKTVFAFRLAFILEIKKVLGITLPIILDSPAGKEVDKNNVNKMVDILKRDFSDHQLIIASINNLVMPNLNIIEIKEKLLEEE